MRIIEIAGQTYVVRDSAYKAGLVHGLDGTNNWAHVAFYRDVFGQLLETRVYTSNSPNKDKSDTSVHIVSEDAITPMDDKSYYMELFDDLARARAYAAILPKGHECVNSGTWAETANCDQYCGYDEWPNYHNAEEEAEMRAIIAYFETFATGK